MRNIGIAEDKTYEPFIDGLRGIAILMVVAVHTSQFCGNTAAGCMRFGSVEALVNAGARGVQLFFLISAYTLFSSSKNRFASERFPTLSFYIRRAFRILPLWWLVNVVCILKSGRSLMENLPSFLMYFGFMRYRETVEVVPGGWSLFVEETFYVLLPLIFPFVTSVYRAAWLFLGLLLLSPTWTIGAYILRVPATNDFIFLFPISMWFCFGLGIFLFYLKVNSTFRGTILANRDCQWLLDASALLSLGLFLTAGYQIAACVPLSLMFIAAMSERTFFGRLTRHPLLMRFGTYCYSIYLLHYLILSYLDPQKERLFAALGLGGQWIEMKFLIWFPLVSSLCLVVGAVVFRLVEKPCVRLGKRCIKFIGVALEAFPRTLRPPA